MPSLLVPPGGPDSSPNTTDTPQIGSININVVLSPKAFDDHTEGVKALEYPVTYWTEPLVQCYRTAPSEIRSWVEVKEGHFFGFEMSIDSRNAVTAEGLKFTFFLDDQYVDYMFMEAEDCTEEVNERREVWMREVARCGRFERGIWHDRLFQFEKIPFEPNISDIGESLRSKKRAAGVGNLRVEVYRIKKRAVSYSEQTARPNYPNESCVFYNDAWLTHRTKIDPKDLNGRAVSLCSKLGKMNRAGTCDPGDRYEQADDSTSPIAIFHFEYRTRGELKALGIIPRSPEPEPALRDKEIETLTEAEKTALLLELKTELREAKTSKKSAARFRVSAERTRHRSKAKASKKSKTVPANVANLLANGYSSSVRAPLRGHPATNHRPPGARNLAAYPFPAAPAAPRAMRGGYRPHGWNVWNPH